jgi:hypothetical protein
MDIGNSTRVVVHEVLHTISNRLIQDGYSRGYKNLIEGMTELYARRVTLRRFGKRDHNFDYQDFVTVAGRLEEVIGKERMKAIFVSQGLSPVGELRRAVEEAGYGDVFDAAMMRLEREDWGVEDLLTPEGARRFRKERARREAAGESLVDFERPRMGGG